MNKFPSVTYPAMDLPCIFPVSQSLQGVEFRSILFANMAATDKKKNKFREKGGKTDIFGSSRKFIVYHSRLIRVYISGFFSSSSGRTRSSLCKGD